MDKPAISKKFTMEDLYKIRERNSLRWKHMTLEELQADLKPAVDEFNSRIAKIRNENKKEGNCKQTRL